MSTQPAQPDPPTPPLPPPAPLKRRSRNQQLAHRADANIRPAGYLPPEIACQSPLAQKAFVMLCAKPGRSLRSIAKELGTSAPTLNALSRAGRWSTHLAHFMRQSTESLLNIVKEEACRSRRELLASNRLAEASLDAALNDLVMVDEHGNPQLRPGKTIQDVQRLHSARHTAVKTTMMLTGEDTAQRVAAARAGATKIVLGNVEPVPVTVEAIVIGSEVPTEGKMER